MAIGEKFYSTPETFIDSEYGYKIIKPVNIGKNRTLYFTSNPFLEDNTHLIFSSFRDGKENLYKLNYITGEYIQLTDRDDLFTTTGYIDRKNNVLYCRTPKSIISINLETCDNKEVVNLAQLTDDDVQLLPSVAITCDGKYLISAYPYKYYFKNNDQETICDNLYRIFKVNLKTLEQSDVRYTNYRLDHIQCSPVDPNYFIYCAWGYWPTHQRTWGCRIDNNKGGALGNELTNEHRTHEYFIGDGTKIAYHGKFFKMENNVFKKFQDTFGIMNFDGTDDKVFVCEKGYTPGHSCMTTDKEIIIADGKNKISVLTLDYEKMTCKATPIFTHHSSMNCNFVHPHPSISYNKRFVVFATDNGKGEEHTNFYLIDLESKKR